MHDSKRLSDASHMSSARSRRTTAQSSTATKRSARARLAFYFVTPGKRYANQNSALHWGVELRQALDWGTDVVTTRDSVRSVFTEILRAAADIRWRILAQLLTHAPLDPVMATDKRRRHEHIRVPESDGVLRFQERREIAVFSRTSRSNRPLRRTMFL
jgi:hypothetical protein